MRVSDVRIRCRRNSIDELAYWLDSKKQTIGEHDTLLDATRHRLVSTAIDIAEKRQDCLGKGYSVSIVDDAGIEIHRESVDSAEKSG